MTCCGRTRSGSPSCARNIFDTEIADRDLITLGLVTLANRERQLLLQHFRHRSVSRAILEQLLTAVERLSEGARTAGRTGYNRAARRLLAFGACLPARPRLAALRRPGAPPRAPAGRSLRAPAGQQDRARGAGSVVRLAHAGSAGRKGGRHPRRNRRSPAPGHDRRARGAAPAIPRLRRSAAAPLPAPVGASPRRRPISGVVPGGADRPRALQQSPA